MISPATAAVVPQLLIDAADRLRSAGVETPEQDARLLLAHAAGTEPGRLALLDRSPDPTVVARFQHLIDRRLARVPLQHLTGVAYFRHLELAVGPGVFVPRPETEVMVGWAIEQLRMTAHRALIAIDLGTGSGAIAKSIMTELPGAQVFAVEISPGAAAWAERNLRDSGVRLVVAEMATALPELNSAVDLVIANPPYLRPDELIAAEARDHDPAVALFADESGLGMIKVVIDSAARLLRPGGLLCVEHSESQGDSVPTLITAYVAAPTLRGPSAEPRPAFGDVADHADLTGRPRFTTAIKAR